MGEVSGRSSEHVLIDDLSDGESPRLEGLDDEHVRRLAETEEPLPPIVVHRAMMQVVDGRHRLRAARLRGAVRISASFLDCAADDVFVEAVRANAAHGLPLSLPDRKAAAARIVRSHPRWSDRTIASVTGLSHKTVGKIRREQPDGGVLHLERTGSAVAAEIIRRNPEMPLRQVAKAARPRSAPRALDWRHDWGRKLGPAFGAACRGGDGRRDAAAGRDGEGAGRR